MNVIKRSGEEVVFDPRKILNAIGSANKDVTEKDVINATDTWRITNEVVERCTKFNRAMHVEEIQDIVEQEIAKAGYFEASKQYMLYRYKRMLERQKNTTDDKILALIDCKNEELIQENSNKNPTLLSVQRDYMAGEVNKDICRRFLYPKEVMEANDKGAIHIHDLDYVAEHVHNCELINLEDMLQNGTVINGSLIEPPKSFLTACTVATQISASVASNTFGGQTITLSHLAPFIDISRQKFIKQVREEFESLKIDFTDEMVANIAEQRVRREIKSGVQTIQYQVSTIMCSNG